MTDQTQTSTTSRTLLRSAVTGTYVGLAVSAAGTVPAAVILLVGGLLLASFVISG